MKLTGSLKRRTNKMQGLSGEELLILAASASQRAKQNIDRELDRRSTYGPLMQRYAVSDVAGAWPKRAA